MSVGGFTASVAARVLAFISVVLVRAAVVFVVMVALATILGLIYLAMRVAVSATRRGNRAQGVPGGQSG
jgi:hypothetical protein